jgi:hypothetical protein
MENWDTCGLDSSYSEHRPLEDPSNHGTVSSLSTNSREFPDYLNGV